MLEEAEHGAFCGITGISIGQEYVDETYELKSFYATLISAVNSCDGCLIKHIHTIPFQRTDRYVSIEQLIEQRKKQLQG